MTTVVQFRPRSMMLAVAAIAALLGGLAAWHRAHQASPGIPADLIMEGVRSFEISPGR